MLSQANARRFYSSMGNPTGVKGLNTCLDEMEDFKGRDIAFVSDLLRKKGF